MLIAATAPSRYQAVIADPAVSIFQGSAFMKSFRIVVWVAVAIVAASSAG